MGAYGSLAGVSRRGRRQAGAARGYRRALARTYLCMARDARAYGVPGGGGAELELVGIYPAEMKGTKRAGRAEHRRSEHKRLQPTDEPAGDHAAASADSALAAMPLGKVESGLDETLGVGLVNSQRGACIEQREHRQEHGGSGGASHRHAEGVQIGSSILHPQSALLYDSTRTAASRRLMSTSIWQPTAAKCCCCWARRCWRG